MKRRGMKMSRFITKSDGTVYSPTNLEIQRDLKMLAKENRVNLSAVSNAAIHAELIKIGVLIE